MLFLFQVTGTGAVGLPSQGKKPVPELPPLPEPARGRTEP